VAGIPSCRCPSFASTNDSDSAIVGAPFAPDAHTTIERVHRELVLGDPRARAPGVELARATVVDDVVAIDIFARMHSMVFI
jgi:hypothetical protein